MYQRATLDLTSLSTEQWGVLPTRLEPAAEAFVRTMTRALELLIPPGVSHRLQATLVTRIETFVKEFPSIDELHLNHQRWNWSSNAELETARQLAAVCCRELKLTSLRLHYWDCEANDMRGGLRDLHTLHITVCNDSRQGWLNSLVAVAPHLKELILFYQAYSNGSKGPEILESVWVLQHSALERLSISSVDWPSDAGSKLDGLPQHLPALRTLRLLNLGSGLSVNTAIKHLSRYPERIHDIGVHGTDCQPNGEDFIFVRRSNRCSTAISYV